MQPCPHIKHVKLLPGEEAERMKPPYTCQSLDCTARPMVRCLTCGMLVCDLHARPLGDLRALISTVTIPPPSGQALLRRGDKITSIVDGTALHAIVKRVDHLTFRWRARDRSTHDDVLAYEHIEWERGHLNEESKIALLAAHALYRNH